MSIHLNTEKIGVPLRPPQPYLPSLAQGRAWSAELCSIFDMEQLMKTELGLPPTIWRKRETLARAMGWTNAQALGALAEIWNAAVEIGEVEATPAQLAAWGGASKQETPAFIAALRKIEFITDTDDGQRLSIWQAEKKVASARKASEHGRVARSGHKKASRDGPPGVENTTPSATRSVTPSATRSGKINPECDSECNPECASAELCPKGVGGIAVKDSSFTPQFLQENSSICASSSSQAEHESRETSPRGRALIESSGLRKLDDARASAAATDCRRGICYGGQLPGLDDSADEDAYEAAVRARIEPDTLTLVLASYDSCTHLRKAFAAFCDSERKRCRGIAFETLASRFEGSLVTRFKSLLSVARAELAARPDVIYEPHQEEPH